MPRTCMRPESHGSSRRRPRSRSSAIDDRRAGGSAAKNFMRLVSETLADGIAGCSGDSDALIDELAEEGARLRIRKDRTDGRSHQAARGGIGRHANEFLPEQWADRFTQLDVKANCAHARCGKGRNNWVAARIIHHNAFAAAGAGDDARGFDHRWNIGEAAQDLVARQMARNQFDVVDAVLKSDHGVRARRVGPLPRQPHPCPTI